MSSVAQLQAQIPVAQQALAKGQINQNQYNQWYAAQQQLIAQRRAEESKPLLPAENPRVIGSYVRSDQEVKPVTAHNPSNPLEKSVAGYTVQPKNSTQLQIIAYENQGFKEAKDSGRITEAEYNTAMMSQYERGKALGAPEATVPMPDTKGNFVYQDLEIAANAPNSGSFFGPTQGYFSSNGQFNAQIGVGMKGEPIYQIPISKTQRGMSYAENRGLTGLTLATSIALPVTAPIKTAALLLGGGAAFTGGAEAYKYSTTGQHLTTDEAINAFGMGEVAGVGLKSLNIKVFQPRATEYLSRSYEPTLETGELYKPSIKAQLAMKLTGAKPNSIGLQTKASEVLTASYDKQMRLNQKLLESNGDISPWIKTPKEREIINLTGAKVKPLPQGIVSGVFIDEEAMSFKGLQARAYAEAAFDFAATPKSSLLMINRTPANRSISVAAKGKLPLYFGIGKDLVNYKEYFGSESKAIEMDKPQEVFSNQKLSFQKPKMPYSDGKYVSYEPLKSPDNLPKGGGMKPLWASESKVSGEEALFNKWFDEVEMHLRTTNDTDNFNLAKDILSQARPDRLKELLSSKELLAPQSLAYRELVNVKTENKPTSLTPIPTPASRRTSGYQYQTYSSSIMEEEQLLTMPGSVSRLQKTNLSSNSLFSNVGSTSNFKLDSYLDVFGIQGVGSQSIIDSRSRSDLIPLVEEMPYQESIQMPIEISRVTPSPSQKQPFPQILDVPQIQNGGFPFYPNDFKFEGLGNNMLLGGKSVRSRKALRRYPVTKPKDLLRRLL